MEVIHHHHIHFPQEPGLREILEVIREMKKDIMTTLQDQLTKLMTDDKELAADVVALVSIINDIPNRVQAAVAAALAAAQFPDDNTRVVLNNVDGVMQDAIAAARSVLPVSPPPAVDPSGTNTVGAGASEDTVSGDTTNAGAGNDTVTTTGAAGNDSLTGSASSGTDTSATTTTADAGAGGASPPASDASSTTTAPAPTATSDGPAVPPPSASSPS